MKSLIKGFFAILIVVGCSSEGVNSIPDNQDPPNSLQANPASDPRDCPTTSSLIGESRELAVSDIYGISGLVTIVSDCEIEITNFFYNGSGPNVSVYAGIDNNFVNGVNMSVPLNSTAFENQTLNLFLPEGATFNEFNSISIWCFEFDQDFSSASF